MRRIAFVLPLLILISLLALLGYGLTRDPTVLPSTLVGNQAPDIDLPRLKGDGQRLGLEDARGRIVLVNVWASWCLACRSEVPLLEEITQRTGVPIIGLAYKDDEDEAAQWLDQFGNPFAAVAMDNEGQTGIDWGISGVPETFVLDASGKIRDKITGPVTRKNMENQLLPLINKLQASM